MKIYSSDLTSVTEVLTGDLLSIVDANTSGSAATAGLRITGGNANLFLDGQGKQELHTNTISGRIPVAIDPADSAPDGAALTTATGGSFINSSIVQAGDGHVTIQQSDATAANLTITGNLIVQGSTTNVESTNLNVEDQYISINRAFDSSGAATNPSSNEGGILITQTNGQFAGFRYNGSNFQTGTGLAADGTGTWQNLATGQGDVNAYGETFTQTSNTAGTFTITAATHSIAGSDLTVSLYEIGAGMYTKVIPESVTIGTLNAGSGGAGNTLEGTVVVTMPIVDTANDVDFRVVIKG